MMMMMIGRGAREEIGEGIELDCAPFGGPDGIRRCDGVLLRFFLGGGRGKEYCESRAQILP